MWPSALCTQTTESPHRARRSAQSRRCAVQGIHALDTLWRLAMARARGGGGGAAAGAAGAGPGRGGGLNLNTVG